MNLKSSLALLAASLTLTATANAATTYKVDAVYGPRVMGAALNFEGCMAYATAPSSCWPLGQALTQAAKRERLALLRADLGPNPDCVRQSFMPHQLLALNQAIFAGRRKGKVAAVRATRRYRGLEAQADAYKRQCLDHYAR